MIHDLSGKHVRIGLNLVEYFCRALVLGTWGLQNRTFTYLTLPLQNCHFQLDHRHVGHLGLKSGQLARVSQFSM